MLMLLTVTCAFAQKVSLDFTNAKTEWGMPTSNVSNKADTYTNGTYTIEIMGQPSASNGYKAQTGYVILGKKDAYIKLPAMDFKVGKIVVGGNAGASAAVLFNIYAGETAVSTQVTGCTTDHTFLINEANQAAGTQYIIKVESAANLQVTRVDFYEAGSGSDPVSVTGVTLDQTTASVLVGETLTLTSTVAPNDASNKNVTWTSSDEEVATVANGVVSALKTGTTTITVKTEDGNYEASCEVTVKEESKTGKVYKKVTSDLADWTGKYLIVYEAESKALNAALGSGLDVAANTVAVTVEDNAIAGTDKIDKAVVTIDAIEGGYSLKADGVYFGISSYANGLKVNATTPWANTISISDGNAIISQTFTGGTMILNFNANASDKRFRYYKEGSQKPIQLYKFEDTATAIKTVNTTVNSNVMYNLAGQRITKANGIVIMNGKKVRF